MEEVSVSKLLKQKKEAKKELSKKLSFSVNRPVLAVILDNELDKEEEELLRELLSALESLNIEAVILADTNLDAISFAHTTTLPYSQKGRTNLLLAADMVLAFEFSDVEEIMLNGAIPVGAKRKELKNYDPRHENGNSFIYENDNIWGIFEALVRALETFKLPYDWKNIVREGITTIKG